MKTTKDEFVIGKHNIGWISSSFLEKFDNIKLTGKGQMLQTKNLEQEMTDQEILGEFGAEEVTLEDILYMLDHNDTLLKNGYANIFYIKDTAFVACVFWYAFDAAWSVGGWNRGYGWGRGDHVLSRNFRSETVNKTLGDFDALSLPKKLTINGVEYERK